MEFVISLLERLGQAVISLLLNPFYYISILIVLLQMRRLIFFERKLYHSRMHTMIGDGIRVVLWGLAAGLTGSLLMGVVGAYLQPQVILYLWVGALLLSFIRVRFLCFAYVIGLLGIFHGAFQLVPGMDQTADWYAWVAPISELHMPSLLALVGIVHIVEAILVRIQGSRLSTPVFVEGKRGKLVGSYQFQGLWPVPLLLLVPTTGGQALPLTPLFGDESLWSGGWMFLALPVMIGFTNMTTSKQPEQKARRSSGQLLAYGVIVTALAAASEWLPILIIPVSLITIVLHEVIIWIERRDEDVRSPLYVHTEQGLTVLAVLPHSVAKTMGIQPGETIHKVNSQTVRTKEELHQALRLNPAFTRLEVIDRNGERRFVQSALFDGEHHQLGIILCPDEDAEFYIQTKRFRMFRGLRSTLGKHRDVNGQQDGQTISG